MDARFALPADTVLDAAYRIVRVVGWGGFGITYEAADINLGTTIALKEYYPFDFGDRDRTMSVREKSERHKKTFEWGRANFLKEARTLARFDHPSIVRVTRVFEANSTAYMVMSFERGQSFEAWLNGLGRPPTQEELDGVAAPLLDALQVMHAADFLHRDIAPDNIIVRADGSPVLLDFGAARRAVAEMSRSLTGIVKAGYSPHEQYSSDSRLQGPWSDFYALGGTFYRAVTGSAPEEATLRVDEDRMAPASLAAIGSYRPGFLAAIDACLEVKHTQRPQSVAQLRPLLLGQDARASPGVGPLAEAGKTPRPQTAPTPPAPATRRRWPAIATLILVIAGGTYGGYEFTRWQPAPPGSGGIASLGSGAEAQNAELDAERQPQEAVDTPARRQTGLDAEKQRNAAAEREAVAARAEAERRQREERAAAEDSERRKAEAEEGRREEERRRIASRDEAVPKAPPAPPQPDQPARPEGRRTELAVKLGSQPDDPKKGWLGVNMEQLEPPLALSLGLPNANGVVILNAMADSPAARGGMRFGDIVIGLNGRSVPDMDEFRQRLAAIAPGSEARVEVWRVGDDGDFLHALRHLADGGNADSMYRLGRMYAAGLGTSRDDAEAVRWFRKGADAGNLNAETALAVALLEGRGAAPDRQEGLRRLRAAAARDHTEAMSRLGHILLDGRLADRDALEAVRLFTRAADAGHVPSMADLGRIHGTGNGVAADPHKAAMWFKQAADRGNSGGMAGLGWLYEQGKGVEQDVAKAVTWYRRAVDLGNSAAMTDLALLHIQGRGVAKSEAAAIGLYRRAASLGNPVAMNNLAWLLQLGVGVARKEPEEAADLIMKALDRRNEFSYRQMTQSSGKWSKEFRQALQRKLQGSGFFSGRIDGVFGESTVTAINAYVNRSR